MGIMTMQACSMGHNAYAQTLVRKALASRDSAIMDAQETAPLKCVEGSATSTSSTLTHTQQPLMIGAAETQHRTPTTKNGMTTWAIVAPPQTLQKVHGALHKAPHQ